MSNKETKRGKLVAPEKTVIVRKIDTLGAGQTNEGLVDEKGEATPMLARSMEESQDYEYKGEVIAVGSGLEGTVNVGDVVHHGAHAGIVWTFDNEGLKTIREYEFCGIEKKQF